jgi:uncharacterized protein
VYKRIDTMEIFITGGTGFVGSYLAGRYLRRGWQVRVTGTAASHPLSHRENFEYIRADTTRPGSWQPAAAAADVIVNLAGRTIFNYWSRRYKKEIYDSRVQTTGHLVDALDPERPGLLLSASAVGYYGDRGETALTESAGSGEDFLSRLSVDWEAQAQRAAEKGVRVVLMRFGVVLGRGGGALGKMMPAFKWFAGGPLGSGQQWFPWMHIEDLAAATIFFIDHIDTRGPFNLCAPHTVRQGQFARALGAALKRPAFLKTPAFALKGIMGEMGNVLLTSQQVIPHRLLQAGFDFRYPQLEAALRDLT